MKTLVRKVWVKTRAYECVLRRENGGYHYEVRGPLAVITGWTRGNVNDALIEAQEHAKEKLPAN